MQSQSSGLHKHYLWQVLATRGPDSVRFLSTSGTGDEGDNKNLKGSPRGFSKDVAGTSKEDSKGGFHRKDIENDYDPETVVEKAKDYARKEFEAGKTGFRPTLGIGTKSKYIQDEFNKQFGQALGRIDLSFEKMQELRAACKEVSLYWTSWENDWVAANEIPSFIADGQSREYNTKLRFDLSEITSINRERARAEADFKKASENYRDNMVGHFDQLAVKYLENDPVFVMQYPLDCLPPKEALGIVDNRFECQERMAKELDEEKKALIDIERKTVESDVLTRFKKKLWHEISVNKKSIKSTLEHLKIPTTLFPSLYLDKAKVEAYVKRVEDGEIKFVPFTYEGLQESKTKTQANLKGEKQ